ncbi:MAG: hypothetical protein AAF654_00820 [Myxococcota bacterium]
MTAYINGLAGRFALSVPESERSLHAAMGYAAGIDGFSPPRPSAVGDDALGGLTALQAIRAAVSEIDLGRAREWEAVVAAAHASDDRIAHGLELARYWLTLLHGSSSGVVEGLVELERSARSRGFSEMVIEAASLCALAHELAGDLSKGLATARRASRMARTEALPQFEYLASVVLARERRANGEPHLAARILTALARYAPRPWQPWISLELLLSGHTDSLRCDWVADASNQWLESLGEGHAAGTIDSMLSKVIEGGGALAGSLRGVLAAADPVRDVDDPWLLGVTHKVPAHLTGVSRLSIGAPEDEAALAYCLRPRSGRGRRVVRPGFRRAARLSDVVLVQGRQREARMASLIATLVLGGNEGMQASECFAQVYGFPYEPEVHRGVLDVLTHRTRQYLGANGTVVRQDGHITLMTDKRLLVADPRCTLPANDRVLRILATTPGSSAKSVANLAGISVRVAQIALKELNDEGYCRVERVGREYRYSVEDTTFQEPTRS